MPLPTPKNKDKNKDDKSAKSEYMAKCVPLMKKEGKPHEQAIAICLTNYKKASERKKSKGSNEPPTWEDFNDAGNAFIVF